MSLVGTFNVGGKTGGEQVRSSIYLGGKEDAKSLEKLQAKRIKSILNVTPKKSDLSTGVSNYFLKSKYGFSYLRVPIFDSRTSVVQLETEYKDKIVNFISKSLFHGNILVHCHHGISRSTTCVILYLMSKQDMTVDESLSMIRRRRPQAEPIPAFMDFLRREETKLLSDREQLKGKRERVDKDEPSDVMKKKAKRVAGPAIGPTVGPAPPPVKDDD